MNRRVFFLVISALLCLTHCNGQTFLQKDTICDTNYIINISSGTFNNDNKDFIFDNITFPSDKYFKQGDQIMGCICDVHLCVSKCCKAGHGRINEDSEKCSPGFPEHLNFAVYHDNLTVAEENSAHHTLDDWKGCAVDGFTLQEDEAFHLLKDGRVYYPGDNNYLELHDYCIAHMNRGKRARISIQACFNMTEENSSEDTTLLNTLGMLVSIPFLFVTLVVYLILPDKKIQTKCLMAYITCLMFAYFFLVYLQFNSSLADLPCITLAACGIYFFMATFFWMNITCVDMYWTFSGKRTILQGNSAKWKRFGLYCCFANGSPVVLLLIIFSLNGEQFRDKWYYPRFGNGQCWLGHGLVRLLYFYGPMAVLLIINTCLFVFTALTIRRTMVENQKMLHSVESQRHYDSNKQDYKLYIKLFIAMGINWIMEFISWIVDYSLQDKKVPWVWYLTDFCNAIYGIFIFFIFICKRTVWIKLQQRYYIFMGKPNMARALSSRGTSGYQMSQTERTIIDDTTTTVVGKNYHM